MRIVSLLPSATEIICSLGLRESLVGISHECDFPADVSELPRVTCSAIDKHQTSRRIDRQVREQLQMSTALYMLDLPLFESLRPDLIVTQALCDVCAVSAEDVENAICQLPGNPQIINLEPSTLADVFETIERVGAVTDRESDAKSLLEDMYTRIEHVQRVCQRGNDHPPRVTCLEWLDPPFNAGHWTPELVELAGGLSVTGQGGLPSRTLSWQQVIDAQPDVLFIACCGYSIARTLEDLPALGTIPELKSAPFWTNNRIFIADGNHYFNRPGPRLVDSLAILADSLHPDKYRLPDGRPAAVRIETARIECMMASASPAREVLLNDG